MSHFHWESLVANSRQIRISTGYSPESRRQGFHLPTTRSDRKLLLVKEANIQYSPIVSCASSLACTRAYDHASFLEYILGSSLEV